MVLRILSSQSSFGSRRLLSPLNHHNQMNHTPSLIITCCCPTNTSKRTETSAYIGCWDPKRGAIVDISNGYLYAPGDGAQTDIYACLFKKSNGTYLMAVGYNDKDEVFETFLDFFVYDHGHMLNVTKNVFPVRFNKNLFYLLPRWGTTIKVTNTSGKKLYDLVWTGSVFLLKRR